jgi:hypothetical protein
MEAELTIVIPANDADAPLLRLLNSLCRQDYRGLRETKVLLLAVNESEEPINGIGKSDDIGEPSPKTGPALHGTVLTLPELAARFKDRLAIELVWCELGMRAARRNNGASLAATPYVLFLDPDVELPYRAGPERELDRSLLRRAVEAMAQRRLHLVTANVVCLHGCFLDDLLSLANNLTQHASAFLRPFAACTSTGMFLLFDRNEFLRLGGFNEQALFAQGALLSKAIKPERFQLLSGRVQTSNRRMHELGHARIAKGLLRAMLHTGERPFILENALIGHGQMHPRSSDPVRIEHDEQPLASGQHGAVGSL